MPDALECGKRAIESRNFGGRVPGQRIVVEMSET